VEQVDSVAQGRVWTGADAMNAGLVDQLGDFDDAITVAAELAGVDAYNLYWVEEPLSTTERFLSQLSDKLNASLGVDISTMIPKAFQPVSKQLIADSALLSTFNDPKGVYSLCLTCNVE
jgi:protease-4